VGLSDSPRRSFSLLQDIGGSLFRSSTTIPEFVLTDWSRLWDTTSKCASFTTQNYIWNGTKKATASEANNPRNEVGGYISSTYGWDWGSNSPNI
jgi:hypothetical protein